MARETLEQKAMRIAQETGLDYENVLQGMQMGDIDFQMAVAPYMGYKGEIDPRKTRIHSLFQDTPTLFTKGFSVAPESTNTNPYEARSVQSLTPKSKSRETYLFPQEAGTVNILGVENATPSILGHEYRHQEEIDQMFGIPAFGSDDFSKKDFETFMSKANRNYYTAKELNNRVLDIRSSQNESDIKKGIKYLLANDFSNSLKELKKTSDEKEKNKIKKRVDYLRDLYYNKIDEDINRPEIKKYFKEEYKPFNEMYDKKNMYTSPTFLKYISDDKEEKAKTAKTFKESLD